MNASDSLLHGAELLPYRICRQVLSWLPPHRRGTPVDAEIVVRAIGNRQRQTSGKIPPDPHASPCAVAGPRDHATRSSMTTSTSCDVPLPPRSLPGAQLRQDVRWLAATLAVVAGWRRKTLPRRRRLAPGLSRPPARRPGGAGLDALLARTRSLPRDGGVHSRALRPSSSLSMPRTGTRVRRSRQTTCRGTTGSVRCRCSACAGARAPTKSRRPAHRSTCGRIRHIPPSRRRTIPDLQARLAEGLLCAGRGAGPQRRAIEGVSR